MSIKVVCPTRIAGSKQHLAVIINMRLNMRLANLMIFNRISYFYLVYFLDFLIFVIEAGPKNLIWIQKMRLIRFGEL